MSGITTIRTPTWQHALYMLLLTLLVPAGWAEDRALLIGVERYRDRRIATLPGCVADAREVAALLRDGFAMPDEQIRVLLSADATRAAIVAGLDWLVAGSAPGDRVVFYYSGHGSQTPADGRDEVGALDDVLCPSDYDPLTQANMLRDRQLGELFAKLQGRNLTIILDCCHSGTAYKSIGDQVHVDPLYPTGNVIPKYLPPPSHSRGEPAFPTTTATRVAKSPRRKIEPTQDEIVFSACADDQRAEVARFWVGGQWVQRSVFTWALLRGLAGRADSDADGVVSNAELFAFVQRQLSQPSFDFTQTPVLYCPDLYRAQPVFGRTLTLAGPARLFYVKDREATVNRGAYHDVRVGDKFLVVTDGRSPDEKTELHVARVSEFLSFGTLNKDIRFQPPGLAVQPAARLHSFEKLSVFLGRFATPAGDLVDVPPALRGAVSAINKVGLVADQAQCDRIVSGLVSPDGTVQVFIYGRYGRLQSQFSGPLLTAGDELARRLRGQVLLEQLAVLENPAPVFRVDLSVKNGREQFVIYPERDPRQENIDLAIRADRDCYLTLVSIDSQGQVTLLLPNKWQQDAKLAANRTYAVPPPGSDFVFSIHLPPGHDTIKAIATRRPLELRHVSAKGIEQQGFLRFETADLEDLVEDIRTRGIGVAPASDTSPVSGTLGVPSFDWTTATLTIETVLPSQLTK